MCEVEAVKDRQCSMATGAFAEEWRSAGSSLLKEADLKEGLGTLEVLILYEDKETGMRAKRTLDRIGAILNRDRDFETSMWRLDLLEEEPIFKEVQKAAWRADLILLSAHSELGMPEAVSSWLRWWLSQDADEPPALVALLDGSEEFPGAKNEFAQALQSPECAGGNAVIIYYFEEAGKEARIKRQ